MNRLKNESSPYLLQHKDNPVDWFPWGEEAFERAREEDKPILLSIGYSTCHWCHVMEGDAFTDPDVAQLMNRHFINIKVDREEHPDVDQFYMEAIQILTRSGGWPLNCFLTPEGKPFYGGTYFPPEPQHGRPSWTQILENVIQAFQNKREDLKAQAEKITQLIREGGEIESSDELEFADSSESMPWLDEAVEELIDQWDREHGGLGNAPKFPSFPVLLFLFEYGCKKDHEASRMAVLHSLEKICLGGIYDQIGGGLSRYAVDEAWHIPHFEKMIYDNAMLIRLLARVYRHTGDRFWRRYLKKTIDFVFRSWWHEEEGGFYSAFDADSEGEEGKYYVWTQEEWTEVLSGDDREILTEYYQITDEGNWEDGKNIPHPVSRPEDFARKRDLSPAEFYGQLATAEEKLRSVRRDRVAPALDYKKILSWNAWMMSGLIEGITALDKSDDYPDLEDEIQRLIRLFSGDEKEQLLHHITAGRPGHAAYLDDYAAVADLMMESYRLDWDVTFLKRSREITEQALDIFDAGGQPLLSYSSEPVISSVSGLPDFYDQTTPSGNAQSALNLWNLGMIFDKPSWKNHAGRMLSGVQSRIEKFPRAFSTWLQVALRMSGEQYEIAVVGPDYREKATELEQKYIPAAIIMAAEAAVEKYPLLNRTRNDSETLLYLCSQYSCERPVQSIKRFRNMLKER